jgi:AcrR family transcriptional regulator
MGFKDRRLEVTEAAWRVIAREGLDRASMRAIAQELGASTGVVTHYFRDKDELTLFALERVFQGMLADIAAAIEGVEGIDRLEKMIFATLPLTAEFGLSWQIWIAFLGYAIGRDRLMAEHQKRYEFLHRMLIDVLADLQREKFVRNELDVAVEANIIIALVDGIGTGYVINSATFTPDLQMLAIRRHIHSLM